MPTRSAPPAAGSQLRGVALDGGGMDASGFSQAGLPCQPPATTHLSQSSMSQADRGCRSLHQRPLHASILSARHTPPLGCSQATASSQAGAKPCLVPIRMPHGFANLIQSSTSLPGTGCRPQRRRRLPMHTPSEGTAMLFALQAACEEPTTCQALGHLSALSPASVPRLRITQSDPKPAHPERRDAGPQTSPP